jgi:hypothetical protein
MAARNLWAWVLACALACALVGACASGGSTNPDGTGDGTDEGSTDGEQDVEGTEGGDADVEPDVEADVAPEGTEGGADGECHAQVANPALTVTIEGPTQIEPGIDGFGFYTVSIPTDFQNLDGAGMNVAIAAPNAAGCVLERFAPVDKMGFPPEPFDPNNLALSHEYTGPESTPTNLVGVWSYQFLVRNCTNPGPLLLLAAMNAFDGDGTEEGEVWNKTQLDVTVPEPGAALLGAGALAVLAALRRTRA